MSGPAAQRDRSRSGDGVSGTQDAFAAAQARLSAARTLRNKTLRRIAADLKTAKPGSAVELKAYAAAHPDDAEAVWLLAKLAESAGRLDDALALFEECLSLAPEFIAARFGFARLLRRLHRYAGALEEADRLLATDSRNLLFRQFKADVLSIVGEDAAALVIWHELVRETPERAEGWLLLGHALRANGLQEDAILAYRQAIARHPSLGAAWWALANLKTFRFSDDEIAAMRERLRSSELSAEDRANLLYALGKAREDHGDYAGSFESYAKGNAGLHAGFEYDEEGARLRLQASKAVFTPAFFASHGEAGDKARDPIFVVGCPRSGSTLIEQILASHPAVEGTSELPYIAELVRGLAGGNRRPSEYPYALQQMGHEAFGLLGQEYLARAKVHRKSGRPCFIDKTPANCQHTGFIRLILPNAKIIDARRHPAAACLSMFKQNFSRSNLRLRELGFFYRHYVELMAHFDRVLPGRIHRVIYENMVADPEGETRRLLDYLELPFDERCLRFYETDRAVRTPSSEQVRRPISSEAVEHWRRFEPWLSPLLKSLGSVLTAYPAVPLELASSIGD
ncbi:MAG: sulfotransferase [Alphaproteobacteria bacterium]|nr:sulfotransferase [Alphaproteobacteria bacterium]